MLSIGALLDDVDYSDVTFSLPRGRTIRAMSGLLSRRASYFEMMFASGFREALPQRIAPCASEEDAAEALFGDSDYEDDLDVATAPTTSGSGLESSSAAGAERQVAVRDAAYSTYRALLYYLYTDSVVFAPLRSSFAAGSPESPSSAATVPSTAADPASRREWIAMWCQQHPERARHAGPCSPKSIYRLADKLGLPDLKARAFAHIASSLSPQNIIHEAFGAFSANFADVRMMEVDYLQAHWGEIRSSSAMREVWPAIRRGEHPGFELVWPTLASRLALSSDSDGSSESQTNLTV